MKLIAIGVGGSGASCIECLVHLAALGILPRDVDLIPVMVDPDQQHPRIQATSRFITQYSSLRERGGEQTDGAFGTRISRIVSTNALRPSECENLFGLIGLHQPAAKSLARLFFSEQEVGGPQTREFANGYYGHVNAGVCFFNDPRGRQELIHALRVFLLGGDAVVVLIGSSFGGTGAAGLVHLARVFREDEGLRNVSFKLAAIQLEPFFKPDHPTGASSDDTLVNIPDTFEGRTGAAYHFLFNLADGENIPFDAFYPLGVRTPSAFPQDWFKRDQQNNPHLFVEYLSVLAVRDFVVNHRELSGVARHLREAIPPYEEPLDVLRKTLWEATVLQRMLSSYLLPLLARADESRGLPGHPWIAALYTAAKVQRPQLIRHFTAVRDLLTDALVAAGIDRDGALQRAGLAEASRADALRKTDLTRESFPAEFAPRAENLDLAASVAAGHPEALFDTYDVKRDGTLFVRALHRWTEQALRIPTPESHTGPVFHQWTQQEDMLGPHGQVLGIPVPSDDEFRGDPLPLVLRRLAAAKWRRPANTERTPAEYPTIWAPALVHREEVYGPNIMAECRYLHLGLLAAVILKPAHLISPPVRLVQSIGLSAAFRRSIASTFPLANGHEAMIAPDGVLVIYQNRTPLEEAFPPADDVVGFFYPDTVVVPAAGISPQKRADMVALGKYVAGRGFPALLASQLEADWVTTLEACRVPGATDRGTQFIEFLQSFDDPLIGDEPLTLEDRFAEFPVPNAADWIHRLYR